MLLRRFDARRIAATSLRSQSFQLGKVRTLNLVSPALRPQTLSSNRSASVTSTACCGDTQSALQSQRSHCARSGSSPIPLRNLHSSPIRAFSSVSRKMAEISSLPSRTAMPSVIADNLEKPQLDNRTYRVIELSNKLEVLLIHDPETDKASAAMDVNVGSFSDTASMPGIAHAVEHLLFMGTEKFPQENDYSQYLQKYGGYSNAFTAYTDTNYFFELSATSTASGQTTNGTIENDKAPLYGALDRFSQFFVNPLFLEDCLDRELRAVDSENKKNLQSDTWRLNQLGKSLANQEHPYHKFSTGNYQVLHDDPLARGVKIRKEFIEFYKAHYSANRMKLAVLGRESLDQLESWVSEFFQGVPNQDLPQQRWDDVPAYSDRELGTQIFAKPIKDMRSLELIFSYPDEEELWESHPGRYIAHLVGHEGPGSLLAYIKEKGWANGLGAGPRSLCPGTGLFSITIELTEEGLKRYQDVVKATFQYITMVKEQPPQQWIVDEMKQLAEVDFRFRQQIPASRTTSHLSGVMQKSFPRDKLLSAQSLFWKFDPKLISRGLDHLHADNFRLTLIAQDYPGDWDHKEKWYGTEYKVEKIPSKFMEELRSISKGGKSGRPSELHFPAKNEFIPTKLDVEKKQIEKPATAPKLIRNDTRVRTWWKKDDQFWAPKANVNLMLRSPAIQTSALTATLTKLVKDLVADSLVEYAYDAELAGLDYNVATHSTVMDVTVSGYNDKLHVLLEKVLLAIRDLQVRDDRFEIIKDRLLRALRNAEYDQPYQQISGYSRWLMASYGYIMPQLLDELPSISAEDVRRFIPQLLSQLHVEILAHGNLYREDALRLTDIVESVLSKSRTLPQSQWPVRRSLLLPPGSSHVYKRPLRDPENVNHCIDYILYTNLATDRATRAKLLLLAQMVDEPVFDTLRTKEQLGYVVASMPTQEATIMGLRILIQSERDPDYLEKRIDVFLTKYAQTLKDMSQQDFDSFKIALINKRLEKLKNLNAENGRFWTHITGERFDFELVHRDVEHIEPLTKKDLIDFFEKYIDPASTQRAKLAVHLIAQAKSKSDTSAQEGDIANGAVVEVQQTLEEPEGGKDGAASGEKAVSAGQEATLIEDVRVFKAGMPFTEGAVPVRDLSEFEELEPKL